MAKEVFIPTSLKEELTHVCPQVVEKDKIVNSKSDKVRAVLWGSKCRIAGCLAENPPRQAPGALNHRSEVVGDTRAADLVRDYPDYIAVKSMSGEIEWPAADALESHLGAIAMGLLRPKAPKKK